MLCGYTTQIQYTNTLCVVTQFKHVKYEKETYLILGRRNVRRQEE